MRHRVAAIALVLPLTACDALEDAQNAPEVVAVEPADGSALGSKCPIRVQFNESIEDAELGVGGSIGGPVASVLKTTSVANDTVEFFPAAGEWPLEVQTFSFGVTELFGEGVGETVTYTVFDMPDEPWARAPAHASGTFLQGDFLDVWMADAATGYALLRSGELFKTVDGGVTWAALSPDRSARWLSLAGFDPDRLFLLGNNGALAASTDGGTTWEDRGLVGYLTAPFDWLQGFAAFGEATLLVGHEHGILRSTDGGLTFESVLITDRTYVTGFYLPAANAFFAVGGTDSLFHSVDGGATWTEIHTGVVGLRSVAGDGAGGLLLGGDYSTISRSIDGGITFTTLHADPEEGREQSAGEIVLGFGQREGGGMVAVGSAGTLYASVDGLAWSRGQPLFPDGINAVFTHPASGLWAAGNDAVLAVLVEAEEEGEADTLARVVDGTSRAVASVWVSDEARLTAVGAAGLILTSDDGGASFVRRGVDTTDTMGTTAHLTDVWGEGDDLWVTAADGSVLYSPDRGASWSVRATLPLEAVAIFGTPGGNLVVVGGLCVLAGTEVFLSSDGGDTWRSASFPDFYCLRDVWAADEQTLWAVGHGVGGWPDTQAGVVASVDGGETWTRTDIAEGTLSGIYGADASNLWAVGYANGFVEVQPLVARTRDGGATWTREYWAGSGGHESVWAADADTVWGVGNNTYSAHLFSTDNPCAAPAVHPAVSGEITRAVHGAPGGGRVWVGGDFGLLATLVR